MTAAPSRARRRLRRFGIVTGLALVTIVVVVVSVSAVYLAWDRFAPERLDVPVGGFTVDAAGVPTHVVRWPAAHPGGQPPLVLIGGFGESTDVWSRVAPLLAADRDVYAYDVRGYGYTDTVPPYTLEADTDQLAGLLATLRLSRPILVGHSLGVAVALSAALRDPGSVTGVLGANGDGTPYFGSAATDRTARGPGARALLVDPVAAALVTAVVRHRDPIRRLVASQCGPGCPTDDAAIDRWRAPFLRPGAVDALVTILRHPLIGLTDDQERAVRVPTAVLYSSEDSSFDAASADATAARLHTTLVVGLPGARHLALLGEPDRFAAAVEPELAALSRTPRS